MKMSVRKLSLCSAIGILPLIILARANSGSMAKAPGQASSVPTFAGNAQHTAIYQPAAQNLNAIHWSTTIDLNYRSVRPLRCPLGHRGEHGPCPGQDRD